MSGGGEIDHPGGEIGHPVGRALPLRSHQIPAFGTVQLHPAFAAGHVRVGSQIQGGNDQIVPLACRGDVDRSQVGPAGAHIHHAQAGAGRIFHSRKGQKHNPGSLYSSRGLITAGGEGDLDRIPRRQIQDGMHGKGPVAGAAVVGLQGKIPQGGGVAQYPAKNKGRGVGDPHLPGCQDQVITACVCHLLNFGQVSSAGGGGFRFAFRILPAAPNRRTSPKQKTNNNKCQNKNASLHQFLPISCLRVAM
jgi:hypothetical protein